MTLILNTIAILVFLIIGVIWVVACLLSFALTCIITGVFMSAEFICIVIKRLFNG